MNGRLSNDEISVLKNLAKQVGEIAADPRWKEKKALWAATNSLNSIRPMVLCPPQGAWNELVPPQLNIVRDPFFKKYEKTFRQHIFRNQYMRDDRVIDNKVYIPYSVQITDWVEGRQRPYDDRTDHASGYIPVILETSDLKKMQLPELILDEKQSAENFAIAQELFGEYLDVIQGEPLYDFSFYDVLGHGTSLIDIWCELRGLDTVFYDLYDEPEFTKEAMQFLMEGTIKCLKQGEDLGIWTLNNNGFEMDSVSPCGTCGIAYSNELPAPDYNGKVRLKDLWGYSMAQEFHPVSAEMLEEFVLPYQAKIADMFAMNAYGCCECNDLKWDAILRHIPRLRSLSVSAASDLKTAADRLKDQYVICYKPNPSEMLISFDPDKIKREMSHAMEMAKDTHLVVILRTIETVMNEPHRLSTWIDTTMELANQYRK